jgi:hypothetical protein
LWWSKNFWFSFWLFLVWVGQQILSFLTLLAFLYQNENPRLIWTWVYNFVLPWFILISGGRDTRRICTCCLLLIDKARAKDKTYIWLSVRWKTKT